MAQAHLKYDSPIHPAFYAFVSILCLFAIIMLVRIRWTSWKQHWASEARLGEELSVVFELPEDEAMGVAADVFTSTLSLKGIHSIAALRKSLRAEGTKLIGQEITDMDVAYINDMDEAVPLDVRTKLVDIKLEAQSLHVTPYLTPSSRAQ